MTLSNKAAADTLSIAELILHDFGVGVNVALGALKIVVNNDSFLPTEAQVVLADAVTALTVAEDLLKTL